MRLAKQLTTHLAIPPRPCAVHLRRSPEPDDLHVLHNFGGHGNYGDLQTVTQTASDGTTLSVTRYEYDPVTGNMTKEMGQKRQGGNWQDFAGHDLHLYALNRMTSTTDALGGSSKTVYTSVGQVVSTTDRYGR